MGAAETTVRRDKDSTQCQAWILLRTDNAAAAHVIEGTVGGSRGRPIGTWRRTWQDGAKVLRNGRARMARVGEQSRRNVGGGRGEAR